WEPSGHDTPDSAGHVHHIKNNANDTTTPSFPVNEDNFVGFGTPVEGAAVHPVQPVAKQTGAAVGDLLKTPGKPRRPRAPKAVLLNTAGENDSLAQEVDPITAAIDAVLANASALSTVVEKPKKMKRARKRDQDGNEAANEEVPSMIMAITGRRGRPPNPDKEKPRPVIGLKGGQARRPGRPPKFNAVDLLSKVDAKLLKRLEAKGKRMSAQRRLEERKRQQLIAEELKKPTEDMCLTDHKPFYPAGRSAWSGRQPRRSPGPSYKAGGGSTSRSRPAILLPSILKTVLARRTGRSEEELCFEERRRSSRVAEEENFSLEESGLVLERGSRRARKEEPKLSDSESPTTASIPELERQVDKLTKIASVEDDPLPGTASLMSTQRGRGRPRKIKPEVELHLRTAKIRRRRRSSIKSVGEEGPGSPNSGLLDLTQAAFKSWLSQSQDVMSNGTCSAAGDAPEGNRPEESIKEMAEKQGQWFNLLPKQPCDDNSLTEPQTATSPSSPPKLLPQVLSALPALAAPIMQPLPASIAPPPAAPVTPGRPGRRRRRGSRGSSPARRGPRGAAAKRRGRPPNAVFQELEQQYFTQLVVKPIPAYPIFELKTEDKDVLLEALQQPWQVQDKAMEVDVSALQWVEDLEQRVIAADLHLKAPPQGALNDAESTTETPVTEFQYYEHDVDPRDDWIVRTKKEWSGLPRIATHPLDLAVLRLANLERNIERRYLKEPLGVFDSKMEGELQDPSKKRTRVKKRRYEEDSSEDETTRRRSGGMTTRHKETPTPSSSTRYSGEGAGSKRRRMTTRNQPDLTFCEIILMEMEAHADAWPFLEPVNPRLVPGYRRIIKNPMDFLTMRERLLQGA
ncbi:hypothetical protein XENOCAPTIV_006044, partial [Xenoophorus captivus]